MKQRIGWRTLARYLAGESSPSQAAAVEAWAGTDARRAELLETSRRAWHSPEMAGEAWDVDAAWRRLADRLEPAPVEVGPLARRGGARRQRLTWALAAAAALALLLLPVLRLVGGGGEGATIATGAGEQRTVRLADGSVVRLAPNTRLRVAADGAREAWLEGTAFFGIAERPDRPFTVHTPVGDARVLGTRFELRTESGSLRLAVLEGRVALTGDGGEEVVEAGHVSQVIAGVAPSIQRPADVQELVDWMGDVLIFQDTPLRQAAHEIERLYGVRVHLADSTLARRTLSATFEAQTLATVVATVCRVVDATCEVQDTAVVVIP